MAIKKIRYIMVALVFTFICFNGTSSQTISRNSLQDIFQNLEPDFVPILPKYFSKIHVNNYQRRPNGFDVTIEHFPPRIRWSKTSKSFLFNGHKVRDEDIRDSRRLKKILQSLIPQKRVSSIWDWIVPKAFARRRFSLRTILIDIFRHLRSRRTSLTNNRDLVARDYNTSYNSPCPQRETTSTRDGWGPSPIYNYSPPSGLDEGPSDVDTVSFPSPTETTSGVCPQGYNAQACQVVELTNQHRQRNGLPPLRVSQGCTQVAADHATDMVRSGFFDHTSPTRGGLHQRARSYGFRSAGENIARGQRSPDEVVRDWISSPGHNSNLLGNFTHIGVARVQNDWVQCFSVE